jgi:transcriptional regulator with XRE-family HTH domain
LYYLIVQSTTFHRRKAMSGKETMGDRIKRWRLRKGWTQRELARATGLDNSWINRLESGEKTNISLEGAKRICQALGISLDYLAGVYDEDGNRRPATADQCEAGATVAVVCSRCEGTLAMSVANA